ncbi:hypothetical protein BW247_14560 [Acidihalobacter ferrooxydans]|uniref:DUF218 domain-containing protein n=2 Tax=Acidihalobacter ferrooxydans TaxID=1765967 RepID=A0A1P8ULM7_9GAMM|nr:hypothetical protein BW247_14560 [Acidihalobacter ferrooxydans]
MIAWPSVLLCMGILGFLLYVRHRRKTGMTVLVAYFVLQYCSSVPGVVYPLAGYASHVAVPTLPAGAQAIVVLGAGREPAPQYGEREGLTLFAAQRVAYAAWLKRRTGLPILLSGGLATAVDPASEAQLMERVLRRDFGLKARWLENRSATTWQNARDSAGILKPLGIKRVLLVTQAWHMPRALWAFRHFGLHPIAAPAGYMLPGPRQSGWRAWVPDARAAGDASLLWHEFLGMLWYRARGTVW